VDVNQARIAEIDTSGALFSAPRRTRSVYCGATCSFVLSKAEGSDASHR
jgi:hypothetical protein